MQPSDRFGERLGKLGRQDPVLRSAGAMRCKGRAIARFVQNDRDQQRRHGGVRSKTRFVDPERSQPLLQFRSVRIGADRSREQDIQTELCERGRGIGHASAVPENDVRFRDRHAFAALCALHRTERQDQIGADIAETEDRFHITSEAK